MAVLKFSGIMLVRGINPYVLVSKKRAEQVKLSWRKPMPVLVRVNGKPDEPWHINMMPVGNGSFYLYLHGDVRKTSATKVGDTVEIELAFDLGYRNGPNPLPAWFNRALEEQPKAKLNWDNLTPSRRKEIVRYLSNLKSAEAKARNLERLMRRLSGENGRYMARTWNDGS